MGPSKPLSEFWVLFCDINLLEDYNLECYSIYYFNDHNDLETDEGDLGKSG